MKTVLSSGSFPKKHVEIEIGGSKSESNRLLVLQAQFSNIHIENLSKSDDTFVLQEGLKITKGTVDVHHGGTAMRFLTAYFAVKEGAEITLTGSKRMQERPIGVLIDALKDLGADIQYLKNPGFPPLKIKGKQLDKNTVNIKADVSSQYISALMLIAPMCTNGLHIVLEGEITSRPYLEMTLSLLRKLGVKTDFAENEIRISSTKEVDEVVLTVESDWSSASYFYSLVALSDKFKIDLKNLSRESLQGDSALVSIYDGLGVHTEFTSAGRISLSKKKIELPDSIFLDLSNTPDLAQTIAVSCFGLKVGCRLTGLHTLKIKETDRLLALKNELVKLGAVVKIDKDSFQLEKPYQIISGKTINTYQDHRMAMAFAPLVLKTNLTINDAEVVSKSYPNFWEDLKMTGIQCDLIE